MSLNPPTPSGRAQPPAGLTWLEHALEEVRLSEDVHISTTVTIRPHFAHRAVVVHVALRRRKDPPLPVQCRLVECRAMLRRRWDTVLVALLVVVLVLVVCRGCFLAVLKSRSRFRATSPEPPKSSPIPLPLSASGDGPRSD